MRTFCSFYSAVNLKLLSKKLNKALRILFKLKNYKLVFLELIFHAVLSLLLQVLQGNNFISQDFISK